LRVHKKCLVVTLSITLILVLVTVLFLTNTSAPQIADGSICYIGVAFGGDTYDQAKAIIDKSKAYTNLFILQSGPISVNETATRQICDYATTQGLSIIVMFGDLAPEVLEQKNLKWRLTFVQDAKATYGSKFLGVYYYDERGGIYLDSDKANWPPLQANITYDAIAKNFEDQMLRDGGTVALRNLSIPIYSSDYALYWWDYRSGYDVMFAEAGWNHTLTQDIALVRGAANFQHKDWGIIVTWTNTRPPYLDSGEEIYLQMRDSYKAGAKYITIFDFPYNSTNPYGIMGDEHFDALQRLWKDIVDKKITQNSEAKAVLILPKNYAWGLRHPYDRIWGFWGPDEKSPIIWERVQTLLNQCRYSLDIAFDDSAYAIPSNYEAVYYWNESTP
jgi:hypothetical protein